MSGVLVVLRGWLRGWTDWPHPQTGFLGSCLLGLMYVAQAVYRCLRGWADWPHPHQTGFLGILSTWVDVHGSGCVSMLVERMGWLLRWISSSWSSGSSLMLSAASRVTCLPDARMILVNRSGREQGIVELNGTKWFNLTLIRLCYFGGWKARGGIEISAVDRAIAAKISTMVVCDVIYKIVYLDFRKYFYFILY